MRGEATANPVEYLRWLSGHLLCTALSSLQIKRHWHSSIQSTNHYVQSTSRCEWATRGRSRIINRQSLYRFISIFFPKPGKLARQSCRNLRLKKHPRMIIRPSAVTVDGTRGNSFGTQPIKFHCIWFFEKLFLPGFPPFNVRLFVWFVFPIRASVEKGLVWF